MSLGWRMGGRKRLSIRMMLVDRALQPGERPAEQEEQRWTQSAESLLMSPARLRGPRTHKQGRENDFTAAVRGTYFK